MGVSFFILLRAYCDRAWDPKGTARTERKTKDQAARRVLMAKEVRVGLVGYKSMGKVHSNAYRKVPMLFDTESVPVLRAICGRTEKAVAEAARKFGWESYETSWEMLLKRQDIDLVDISTPMQVIRISPWWQQAKEKMFSARNP